MRLPDAFGTLLAFLDVVVVAVTLLVLVGRRRNVHVTLAWIGLVVSFPFVGPALYFLFAGFRVRRVGRRKRFSAEKVRAHLNLLFGGPGVEPTDAPVLALASRLTGFPLTAGNRLTLLTGNEAASTEKDDAIRAARRSVWAEYYIVESDETGRSFLSLLAARALEGLDVRLLYDAVGSSGIDEDGLCALRRSGGKTAAFLPVNPFRRRWSTHLRNHRKLLVLDAERAFTGGANVGDEYSGFPIRRRSRPGRAWRDTHILVEGPAARQLARVFAEDWVFQADERLLFPPAAERDHGPGGPIVAVVPSGPDQEENATALAWFSAIGLARSRCWITSPYFVPDEPTQRALVTAALRGVDVRLLLPLLSDAPVVSWAALSFLPPLLSAGVRIWRYAPTVLHAKTMVVDGRMSLVGSANLDVRSFLWNFELGLVVHDAPFAASLEEVFNRDLEASEEVDLRWWYDHGRAWRLTTSAARLLSPLL